MVTLLSAQNFSDSNFPEAALNQTRQYELFTVDAKRKHYGIDEKNGIVLDTFAVQEGLLVEQFAIGGSLLTVKHQLHSRTQMEVEFFTFSTDAIRQSGSGQNQVTGFALLNVQQCTLNKGG